MRWNAKWDGPTGRRGRSVRWERPRKKTTQQPFAEPSAQQFSTTAEDTDPFSYSTTAERGILRHQQYIDRAGALWSSPQQYEYHLLLEKYEAPELYRDTAAVFSSQVSTYRAGTPQRLEDDRTV